jgi:hypothetical protein
MNKKLFFVLNQKYDLNQQCNKEIMGFDFVVFFSPVSRLRSPFCVFRSGA